MLPQSKKALRSQWMLTGLKSDYIFLAQGDQPYRKHENINLAIKKLCQECGIQPGTLFKLSEKLAIRCINNIIYHLDWILDQLGHAEDDVNREHYTGRIKPDLSKIGRVLAESKIK